MTDNDAGGEKPKALMTISVTDVLGAGRLGSEFLKFIERGVGQFAAPWSHKRMAVAEQEAVRGWARTLQEIGLDPGSAVLTLEERAVVRLLADAKRQQANSEAVAFEAIEDFKHIVEKNQPESTQSADVDLDWIDRFWRLAQNVSSPDARTLWGRILARQVTGASEFSPRHTGNAQPDDLQ